MQFKQLLSDDDAVSPVIGVILMVAITVILAAVIGAFVLDFGGQESPPQVQWSWSDESGGDVTLKHGGGDNVNNPGQITVHGGVDSDYEGASLDADPSSNPSLFGSGTITAGDSAESEVDGTDTGTITLVWESSDGSRSVELSEHDYDVS